MQILITGNVPWNQTHGSVIPPPHIIFLDWYNRKGRKYKYINISITNIITFSDENRKYDN